MDRFLENSKTDPSPPLQPDPRTNICPWQCLFPIYVKGQSDRTHQIRILPQPVSSRVKNHFSILISISYCRSINHVEDKPRETCFSTRKPIQAPSSPVPSLSNSNNSSMNYSFDITRVWSSSTKGYCFSMFIHLRPIPDLKYHISPYHRGLTISCASSIF